MVESIIRRVAGWCRSIGRGPASMVICGVLWALLGFDVRLPAWIGRAVRRWGGEQLAHAGGDLWAQWHMAPHPDELLAESKRVAEDRPR